MDCPLSHIPGLLSENVNCDVSWLPLCTVVRLNCFVETRLMTGVPYIILSWGEPKPQWSAVQ